MMSKNLAREMLQFMIRHGHKVTWAECRCTDRKLHTGIEQVLTR